MLDQKTVWARGPWDAVEPSKDIDEVIDQPCPAIMRLPRADWRDYGQEYCGAIYDLKSPADGLYYASMPSPLAKRSEVGATRTKTCFPVVEVRDSRGATYIIADFHNHPWVRSYMSREDRSEKNQIWSIRIQFDPVCRIQKLIPFRGEEHPGELYERQEKTWKLIGIIKPEDKEYGIVTPVN